MTAGRATEGLAGIRVVELGELVSAPYATKLLADLGADVIKIEPSDGDRARRRGPFAPGDGGNPDASGLFLALNTNKRSVVCDERGEHLDTLLDDADIIITNYGPERLGDLGIDLDQLLARRPEVVICSVTPFGLTGPRAHYRAEELNVSHGGGWAYQSPGSSTEVDEPPLKVFGHQSDFHAGLVAATASLAYLERAEQTGVGEFIDLSTMAHITGLLEAAFIAASYMELNPNRLGSRILNPWKILPCSDGLIFLVTVEQDQWERLVTFMGDPEWTKLGLFDSQELRLENEDLLHLYLEEWTSEHTVDELWRGGQAERICFAPVFDPADLEHQDHLQAREFLVEVNHPVAGALTHLGAPFRSSNELWGPPTPAPVLDPAAEPTFVPGRARPAPTDSAKTAKGDHPARPLEGIRVVDLSWVWAGPYASMHLAYLGAEVIKIESSSRPGLGRRLPIQPLDVEPSLNTSAYFNQWEQGKLSVELDLSDPGSVETVKRLVAECDVVIENFATGVMDRLGLDYDELRAVKPDVILASISGYGDTGPLRDFMGYGPTTGPLSGLTALTGYTDGPPEELGLSIGDPAAGITAAYAICAALSSRRTTGEGCYLDIALWEATASNAVEGWMSHAMGAEQPQRMGNRDPLMAPHNCYRTSDESMVADGEPDPGHWISVACVDDDDWSRLADLIDPTLGADPRFITAVDRKRNEDDLDAVVGGWVADRPRWELTELLQAHGIAAYPSMSPQDLLNDDHLAHRGFLECLDHPEVGRRVHTGVPWRTTNGPNGVTRPAPLIGQHTDEVLGRVLGLTPDEVAGLHQPRR